MKKMYLLIGFALMLAITLPLRAQKGCVDSPEDPTIVLALVAARVRSQPACGELAAASSSILAGNCAVSGKLLKCGWG